MLKHIAIDETEQMIREHFGDRPDDTEAVVLNDAGKPVAVVISPERYRALSHDRFWTTVDLIRERNAHLDPDEVIADITQAVEEVRRERRARTG